MLDDKTELPEGTDKIIAGARRRLADGEASALVPNVGQPRDSAGRQRRRADRQVRSGREKIVEPGADKTRGLVGQGLERGGRGARQRLASWSATPPTASMSASAPNMATMPAGPPTAIDKAANSLAGKDRRRTDRRHPRIRPQEPRRRPGRRGDRRLRAGPADQVRPRQGRRRQRQALLASALMLKPADPRRPGGEAPDRRAVSQLVDEGKAYAQAELGVAKAVAAAKADGLKMPAILLGAALSVAAGGGDRRSR